MNYNEQMQDLASQYQAATGVVSFRSADVGVWALANGLWQPSHEAIIMDLIRFGGHLPKGGYDVHNGGNEQRPAAAPAVHR